MKTQWKWKCGEVKTRIFAQGFAQVLLSLGLAQGVSERISPADMLVNGVDD
jgi:hypothetical protein